MSHGQPTSDGRSGSTKHDNTKSYYQQWIAGGDRSIVIQVLGNERKP